MQTNGLNQRLHLTWASILSPNIARLAIRVPCKHVWFEISDRCIRSTFSDSKLAGKRILLSKIMMMVHREHSTLFPPAAIFSIL